MTKLGLFVGENNWRFFSELYAALSSKYSVEVFKTRIYQTPIFYDDVQRLPFFNSLQEDDQDKVISAIIEFEPPK